MNPTSPRQVQFIQRGETRIKTFGNRVMRTAASDQPDRVASIILIGAGGQILPSEETQALYRRWMDPSTPPQECTELNSALMYARETSISRRPRSS